MTHTTGGDSGDRKPTRLRLVPPVEPQGIQFDRNDPLAEPWWASSGLPGVDESALRRRVRTQVEDIRQRAIAIDRARRMGSGGPADLDQIRFGRRSNVSSLHLTKSRSGAVRGDSNHLADQVLDDAVDRLLQASSGEQNTGSSSVALQIDREEALDLLFARLLLRLKAEKPVPATKHPLEKKATLLDLQIRDWQTKAPVKVHPLRASIWWPVGLMLTLVMAFLIIVGQLLPAAIILTVKLGLSMALYPWAPNLKQQADSANRSLRACVAGHMGDLIGLGSVGLALAASGRPMYAAAAGMGLTVVIGGTIHRLAAMQEADYIPRLTLERLTKNLSLLGALWAGIVWQGTIPSSGFPVLVLALALPTMYGLFEHFRVVVRAGENTARRRALTPAALIADEEKELRAGLNPPLDEIGPVRNRISLRFG